MSAVPAKLLSKAATGYLVPAGDEQKMAERIIELLGQDKPSMASMGAAGRKCGRRNFPSKRNSARTEELYDRLTSRTATTFDDEAFEAKLAEHE